MSTILDALRKVERDRDPALEAGLDAPTASVPVRRRRSFPIGAIVACAVLGFGGGAVLSWLLPSEPSVEVATLPKPAPPPDIAVPRPPLQAKPAPPAAPAAYQAVAVAPPPPVAMAPPAAVAPRPDAVPPRAPVGVPPAVAPQKAPDATAPETALEGSAPALAAVDPKASALEPSPFGPTGNAAEPATSGPAKKSVADVPDPPARAEAPERQDLAGLAPSVPPMPEAPAAEEAVIEPEPEPETPPETIVDTGRSPPGAPKVALSFLQWSKEPARRFAFISIDGAPTQRIREGEVAAGLTVSAITPTGVQFKREGTTFVIRPRH